MNDLGFDVKRPGLLPSKGRISHIDFGIKSLSAAALCALVSCASAPQKVSNPAQWSQDILNSQGPKIGSIWIQEGAVLWQKPEDWGQNLWTLDSVRQRVDSVWLQSAPHPTWFWADSLKSTIQDVRRPWKQGWLRLSWPLPEQNLGNAALPNTQNVLIIHRLILSHQVDLSSLLEGNSQDIRESEVDSIPVRKAVPPQIQTALAWTLWNPHQKQYLAYGTHFGEIPLPQANKSLEDLATWKAWWSRLEAEVLR